MKIIFIYTLSDPRTGFVRYVGKACDIQKRFRGHMTEKRNTHKTSWIKSLKAIGLEPTIEILEEIICERDSVWQEAERFWIESLRQVGCNLTNLMSGGVGGGNHSKETREKISLAGFGRKASIETRALISQKNVGKIISQRQREQLSKLKTGTKMPLELRLKLSKIHKSSPKCREHIKNLSEERRGKPLSEFHRNRIRESMTEEVKSKISQSKKGHFCSDETREKMSLAHKKIWSKRKNLCLSL